MPTSFSCNLTDTIVDTETGKVEPHACTATVNEDSKVTIWCCTQGHFDVRSLTAQVLGEGIGNIKESI